MKYLVKRNGKFYYHRRVPAEVSTLDRRALVKKSLKTDSLETARQRVSIINDATEEFWGQLARGVSHDAAEKYQAAVDLARGYGFAYRSVEDLASGDLRELHRRLEAFEKFTGSSDANNATGVSVVAGAVLGGVSRPPFTLSLALVEFWRLAADRVLDKNPDQIKRWRNPRIKAINNLIEVLGADRRIDELSREDALEFRDWWLDKLRDEGLTANSANKDIGHCSDVVRTVSDGLRIGLVPVFGGLRIRDTKTSERVSFAVDHVQNVLLDPARLASLNTEARMMVLAMADTGAGVNELCGLDQGDINLAGKIPYIHIRSNEFRSLKTAYRQRMVPLVGVAAEAFKTLPSGFEKYRGKNVLLSSTINKYLRTNGLLPSSDHSLYSLRHTFQDQMNKIEVPERIMAELMGHKYQRPLYGGDVPLEQKRLWLDKMAFQVRA